MNTVIFVIEKAIAEMEFEKKTTLRLMGMHNIANPERIEEVRIAYDERVNDLKKAIKVLKEYDQVLAFSNQ